MLTRLLLAGFAITYGFGFAAIRANPQAVDGFEQFFSEFKIAVTTDDKDKLISMISFDDFTWEGGDLGQLRTKEEFLEDYDLMFTKNIKGEIAKGKPEKRANGSYDIVWHSRQEEYSLFFSPQKDGTYKFSGLTEEPY
ncbi:MAG TPA: hypothetical protein VJX67_09690 [Blastocatellia bacterium]|nr:hypothetical protein [Blastocatellia bacterium]